MGLDNILSDEKSIKAHENFKIENFRRRVIELKEKYGSKIIEELKKLSKQIEIDVYNVFKEDAYYNKKKLVNEILEGVVDAITTANSYEEAKEILKMVESSIGEIIRNYRFINEDMFGKAIYVETLVRRNKLLSRKPVDYYS